MTPKEQVLEAYNKYHNEFDYAEQNKIQKSNEQFYLNESEFLYSLIRMIKPKTIIEISPDQGFTSTIMLKALEKNDIESKIYSFDIREWSNRHDRKTGKIQRELILGDVHKTLSKDLIKKADFILMDSDHSYEFGQWYSTQFKKDVKPGTFIMVHDWPGYASDGATNNIIAEFAPPWYLQELWNIEVRAVKLFFIEPGHAEPVLNVNDWLKETKQPYYHTRDGVPYRAFSPSQILIKK